MTVRHMVPGPGLLRHLNALLALQHDVVCERHRLGRVPGEAHGPVPGRAASFPAANFWLAGWVPSGELTGRPRAGWPLAGCGHPATRPSKRVEVGWGKQQNCWNPRLLTCTRRADHGASFGVPTNRQFLSETWPLYLVAGVRLRRRISYSSYFVSFVDVGTCAHQHFLRNPKT